MIKLSKYVRSIECSDEIALYNTINHALIQLPKEAIQNGTIVAELDTDSYKVLNESYFFADTDTAVESSLSSYLLNEKNYL